MWSVMAIYLVISLCAALVSLGNSRPFGALPVAFSTGGGGKSDTLCQPCFSLRGGTSDDESEGDDYDSDVDESEDEEEDDTLLSSTVKATTKTQTKKTASVKKAVSAGLAEAAKTTTKSKKSKLRLPYLLRAIFNPLTVFAMTKAYWSSLFNLEYGKDKEVRCLYSNID